MHPAELIRSRGGVLNIDDLRHAGVSRRLLTHLVDEQQLRRPRRGWYSTLDASHPRFRAVRAGGRLTGASALFDMGAWMLHPPPAIEVAVIRGSSRLHVDDGVVLHWESSGDGGSASVVSLPDALFRVILDHDLEVAVPCLDWALHSGRMGRIGFERLLLTLPQAARCIREWVDPASQSVLESLARVRLLRRGWRVRSQVRVGDIGAIDLVVNDHVAVELDGREHHESSFVRDRRKDLQIAIEGRHCLRASYAMVVDEWPRLEAAIAAALRRRGVAHNSVISIPEPRGRRHASRRSGLSD